MKQWYSEINPATLSGAIDVIVVEQADGTFLSSPFHVRFGKLGLLKAKETIVDVEVNDVPVDHIIMKVDDNGVAHFVDGSLLDHDDHDDNVMTLLEYEPQCKTNQVTQESHAGAKEDCSDDALKNKAAKKKFKSWKSSGSKDALKGIIQGSKDSIKGFKDSIKDSIEKEPSHDLPPVEIYLLTNAAAGLVEQNKVSYEEFVVQ